jgi:hypothetical protein
MRMHCMHTVYAHDLQRGLLWINGLYSRIGRCYYHREHTVINTGSTVRPPCKLGRLSHLVQDFTQFCTFSHFLEEWFMRHSLNGANLPHHSPP